MLGDIVDLWWKPTDEIVQESSELMLELSNLDMKKYYLIGNHDFNFKNIYPLEINFEIIEGLSSTKTLIRDGIRYDSTLRSKGKDFRFIHGHQISYWHALPFYEVFCEAMCGWMNADSESNVWDTICTKDRASQKIRRGIDSLSKEERAKLEHYLAGPLELGPDDEPKSVLEEWELLRRFFDITRIRETLENGGVFKDITKELEDLASILDSEDKPVSRDSTNQIIEVFAEIWREILRRMDQISEGKMPGEPSEEVILKARRLAAMLTTGLRSNEFLIHGHSHHAYLSESQKSADPGHWLGSSGSYLTIDDGEISLEFWNA
jgi:UDP-2,3-diacylglucosamine pyrophosphatase LpxH